MHVCVPDVLHQNKRWVWSVDLNEGEVRTAPSPHPTTAMIRALFVFWCVWAHATFDLELLNLPLH